MHHIYQVNLFNGKRIRFRADLDRTGAKIQEILGADEQPGREYRMDLTATATASDVLDAACELLIKAGGPPYMDSSSIEEIERKYGGFGAYLSACVIRETLTDPMRADEIRALRFEPDSAEIIEVHEPGENDVGPYVVGRTRMVGATASAMKPALLLWVIWHARGSADAGFGEIDLWQDHERDPALWFGNAMITEPDGLSMDGESVDELLREIVDLTWAAWTGEAAKVLLAVTEW